MTTRPHSIYMLADGCKFIFSDPREADRLAQDLDGIVRYFIGTEVYDPPILDRSILKS